MLQYQYKCLIIYIVQDKFFLSKYTLASIYVDINIYYIRNIYIIRTEYTHYYLCGTR
jgi:hypothetical protein